MSTGFYEKYRKNVILLSLIKYLTMQQYNKIH